ncbi:MAG: DNA/RNA nuclease SfsA [Alphaproteobacteria bacterium]
MLAFSLPLLRGTLVKRYKRFLADVLLETGELVCAHCPNTGAMLGLTEPGVPVWMSQSDRPTRKLKYTWELVEDPQTGFIGVNTGNPNALVKKLLAGGGIPEFSAYPHVKAEVYAEPGSRLDFFLQESLEIDAPNLGCYIEVKNAHFKQADQVLFPDSPTQRGAKHMEVLERLVQRGFKAFVLYIIQREDCSSFSLATELDPAYAKAAAQAFEKGVQSLAYSCKMSPLGIELGARLPILFL